jgi:hypothetical protein
MIEYANKPVLVNLAKFHNVQLPSVDIWRNAHSHCFSLSITLSPSLLFCTSSIVPFNVLVCTRTISIQRYSSATYSKVVCHADFGRPYALVLTMKVILVCWIRRPDKNCRNRHTVGTSRAIHHMDRDREVIPITGLLTADIIANRYYGPPEVRNSHGFRISKVSPELLLCSSSKLPCILYRLH